MENKIELDMNNIPESIAIIMDGNGRWAKEKGLPRSAGHVEGVETVTRITSECARLGVKYLTMYTFSTENFMKNNVRFRLIGDITRLPQHARHRLEECMANTANNTRMTAITALNYSSRWELTKTMQQVARDAAAGKVKPEEIDEHYVSAHLETNFMTDPDLLIRTGGELRISNYLLWQCAYSEFYFCDTYWPDFKEEDLHKAIAEYQRRQRRFGKTGDQIEEEKNK